MSKLHTITLSALFVACTRLSSLDVEQSYPYQPSRDAHLAGDLDADGDVDLVVELGDALYLGKNNGAGSFDFARCEGVGYMVEHLSLADADADGDLDLFGLASFMDGNTDPFLVRLQGGECLPSERIARSQDAGANYIMHMVVAEVTGDAAPDLILLENDYYGAPLDLVVIPNDTRGNFETQRRVVSSGVGLALDLCFGAADFNADGNFDLAITGADDTDSEGLLDAVFLLMGDGSGGFRKEQMLPISLVRAESMRIGDLDGDGLPDLVITGGTLVEEDNQVFNRGRDVLLVLYNDDSQGFSRNTRIDGRKDYANTFLADTDQDGDLDIITDNFDYGMIKDPEAVEIVENRGGHHLARSRYGLGDLRDRGFEILEVGDFDGDGDIELLGNLYVPDDELMVIGL